MCLALYLATHVEPPALPWNESAPGFNVVGVGEHERAVSKHLSKRHLRYLGAHTGCSCGFAYGRMSVESEDEQEEERLGRKSVADLRVYLEQLVAAGETVELYACWEGDWDEPCESSRNVTPDFFGGDSFELPERELMIVRVE